MSDTIGNVTVPEVSPSGTFPLQLEWPIIRLLDPEIKTHQFGAGNAKREQHFLLGRGVRRWEMNQTITEAERVTLYAFWEARKGSYQPFTFNAPNADQTFTAYTVQFENEPFVTDHETGNVVSQTIRLREVATGDGPAYTLNSTQTRFPSGALTSALSARVQELIPLVKIKARDVSYPEIFLSDRRCTIGGQLYQARLLENPTISQSAIGVPGQSEETDDTSFKFGNADRVMRDLAFDVMLDFARVEYSLFHVGTGIKLDLWAGEIQQEGWSVDGIEFSIRCSDFLANPFLIFPNRVIDRVCNAAYNHAPQCPYSTSGALDLVNYPDADAITCDHNYETPNGCLAHGMARFYRGVPITPQNFRVKDTSRGDFVQPTVVSVSQVADSVMGKALPFIFTDVDLPVNALVVAGIDKDDVFQAVGIAGQGPLGAYGLGHKVDGKDIKPGGIQVLGSEPAGANDYLSLSDKLGLTVLPFRTVVHGGATFLNNYSAGLAFLVLSCDDEKGVQLNPLSSHSVQAVVRQGLGGWIWSAPGTSNHGLLTNPVWVAINVLLWGLYMETASASDQEARFDVAAALEAAAIQDDVTAKIVGTGSEVQFKSIGIITDQRPLRQWIQDILAGGLCYYRFDFGKLVIGCRQDSGARSAFTAGNLIWKSVKFSPPKRAFNRFSIKFADILQDVATKENQFLPNSATAYDEDLALELGGGERAEYFQAETNLPLVASISQAQRIANTRLREEVGGVTKAERLKHGHVTAQTTILGLDFAAGQVISVTDAEVPDGLVEVRAGRWKLYPDHRVEFEGTTTRDSMYDLVAGPKFADVLPGAIAPESLPYPFRSAWCPNQEQPIAGDAVYPPNCNTFGLLQRYVAKGDAGKQALLDVTGVLPVNAPLPIAQPPLIRAQSFSVTGGDLDAGETYYGCVHAWNAQGYTLPSTIVPFTIPAGAATCKLSFDQIDWPVGTFDGYIVSIGKDTRTMCVQDKVTGSLPASFEFTGPLKLSTWNMPSPVHRRVIPKAKPIQHFGLFGEQVTDIAAGVVTIAALAGLSDDYTGRLASVLADKSDGSANLLFFTVTAHNTTTGELTLDPDPAAAGVEIEDLFTVLLEPNIYTGDTIGDAKFVNGIYPGGLGADPTHERGLLIRGITPGRPHQLRTVGSHTDDTYTLDRPFDFQPLFFIVETASWPYQADSSASFNPLGDIPATFSIVVDNLVGQPMLVGAFLEDRLGGLTPEELVPVRFTYLFGASGNSALSEDGYYPAPIVADEVVIDMANGLNQRIVLDQPARVTIKNPIFTGGTIKAGSWLQLYIEQDGTGARPNPAWESDYGPDIVADQIGSDPDTRNSLAMTFDGTKWRSDYFRPNLPI